MSGLDAAQRARSFRHLSLRITQLHQLAASQLSRDHLATGLADGLREITARLLPPGLRRVPDLRGLAPYGRMMREHAVCGCGHATVIM
jgi:hypothetical protein